MMIKRHLLIFLLSLLFLAISCTEQGLSPTPLLLTSTPTSAAIVATTAIPTKPPSTPTPIVTPTSTPTPVAESHWQCDPIGGLACFADLTYITMLGADEGWAFGQGGVVLHYTTAPGNTQPTWQTDLPLDSSGRAVQLLSMVSDTEGWGVFEGHIFHYQDGKWNRAWENGYINDLVMLDADEGWAVGDDGVILHFTQAQGDWQSVPSPSRQKLMGVAMLNSAEGWAVGVEGTVLHYQAQEWQSISITDTQFYRYLSDIEIINPDEIWIVGDTILHYQAGSWQEVVSSRLKNWLSDVTFVNSDEAWAVGEKGIIYHYYEGQWQEIDGPTDKSLLSVNMVNANEGWAVGVESTILHYTNGTWQLEDTATPLPQILMDIAWLENDTGWAVGAKGLIVYYQDGIWQMVDSPVDEPELNLTLNAVDMVSPEEGWAVGWQGTILHYSQDKWQNFPSPTTKLGNG